MKKIKITAADVTLTAELYDTPTAHKIYNALPLQGSGLRWGDELYFGIPVQTELEDDARDILHIGELGYWPVGAAFCIFWGPTPASQDDEPRAAGKVNIFGRILADAALLQRVQSGTAVSVSKIE